MLILAIIFLTSFECSSAIYTYSYINKTHNELWVDTIPWVGLLLYKEQTNSKDAISGIILLTKKIAVGNTQEISKINKMYIRSTTKAMFMTPEDLTWYCQVVDYILHPEFEHDTLNTVALVKLEYAEEKYQWQLLERPLSTLLSYANDIFAIGFTDRRGMLEQVVYKMKKIRLSDCINFYEEEQLDMKWMRPMQYHCFTTTYKDEQCVFDASMALVTNYTGNWILLGMSTLGPGCSLPSRFLDFSSYVPWIEKTGNITGETKTRRTEQQAYENDWAIDEIGDTEQYFIEKLNDTSIVLKPVSQNDTESVFGSCRGALIYRDEIKLQGRGNGEHGFGVYKFSHFDKNYANITCISLTVECLKKSDIEVWDTQGFAQGDTQPFMKNVPFPQYGDNNSPYKVMKDNWSNHDLVNISNLFFKFEYFKEATLRIIYYGTEIIMTTESSTATQETTSTTKRTRRTRRPHRTHLRPKKAMRRRP